MAEVRHGTGDIDMLPARTHRHVHTHNSNSTSYNPVLPGWSSDPSCVQVHGTFYCVTSTFITFPGLPVYASKDLINWKHISHVWNRESQLPSYSWATKEQYLGLDGKNAGVLFRTTDPFNDASWTNALSFPIGTADPDLFWDNATSKVYMASQGI
ncbi:glycosyl hydrolase [Chaetomium sp. MPI-SDFR-AT-0129]|nr:glycosyl hydrolase [Chaetomium sp. MPI-SDFR-AT-0129]